MPSFHHHLQSPHIKEEYFQPLFIYRLFRENNETEDTDKSIPLWAHYSKWELRLRAKCRVAGAVPSWLNPASRWGGRNLGKLKALGWGGSELVHTPKTLRLLMHACRGCIAPCFVTFRIFTWASNWNMHSTWTSTHMYTCAARVGFRAHRSHAKTTP